MNKKKLTAKQYLEQLKQLDTNINQDLELLSEMKASASNTGGISLWEQK